MAVHTSLVTHSSTRRTVTLAGLSLTGGVAAAACTPGGRSDVVGAAVKAPATIRLTTVFPDPPIVAVIEKQVGRFTQRFPQITVKFEPAASTNDWLQKRKVEAAAGDAVEVSHHRMNAVPELAALGILADLAAYLKRDGAALRVSDIWPDALDAGKYQGKQLGLPYRGIILLMTVFNTNLFQSAGVPTPLDLYARGQWTWQKVRELGAQLTNTRNPDSKLFGTSTFIFGNPDWRSAPLWHFGADLYNKERTRVTLTTPQAVECAEFFQNLACREGTAPVRLTDGYEYADDGAFTQGRLAIGFEWHGSLTSPRYERWPKEVAPLPAFRDKAGVLNAEQVSLLQHGKEKDAGWEYVKFAASPDEQLLMQQAFGYVPGHKHQFDAFVKQADIWRGVKGVSTLNDIMKAARPIQVSTKQSDVNTLWTKYVAGGTFANATGMLGTCQGPSAKDVMETVTREANQILGQA